MEFAPQRPVPVFPLPNAVLFPGVLLPLHIFELRYRTMVRDALSGERMVVMALLRPGWERDYYGNPEYYPLGCLGRFEEVEWLYNDCYNLKLRGVSRVRIGRLDREFPYRTARVSLTPQAPMSEDDPLVQSECHALLEAYRRLAGEKALVPPEGKPLDPQVGYERVVNTLCTFLTLDAQEKLAMLEMDSVLERGRRLRELIERQSHGGEGAAPPRGGN